ncbi:MAG: hypothetical protein JW765_01090 [Deltaproteobacteria bacterium]|nr:hypothetical protein [Candidatus Zymogenaceae bacterium]
MSKKLAIIALLVALSAAVLFVSACTPSGPAGPSLAVDKSVYAPGETITVTFSAPAGLPTNAWVGIIPSNVPHGDEAQNDSYDLTYQYLNGMTSGMLVFSAPTVPGSYDFRMHDTDSNGKEIASITFTVQ